MRIHAFCFRFAFTAMLFFVANVWGQDPGTALAADEKNLMTAAKEIMESATTCALITLDDQGVPRVRTMDPFVPEEDLTVWLGTNPKSRKVSQIKNDTRVTLYYTASDLSGYVALHGTARLIDDPDELKNRWKTEWEAFYPEYPEGYLLIKVSPAWIEVVSYSHGIFGDPDSWQPPRLDLSTVD